MRDTVLINRGKQGFPKPLLGSSEEMLPSATVMRPATELWEILDSSRSLNYNLRQKKVRTGSKSSPPPTCSVDNQVISSSLLKNGTFSNIDWKDTGSSLCPN